MAADAPGAAKGVLSLGIDKEDIAWITHDFKAQRTLLVFGSEQDRLSELVLGLLDAATRMPDVHHIVLVDSAGSLTEGAAGLGGSIETITPDEALDVLASPDKGMFVALASLAEFYSSLGDEGKKTWQQFCEGDGAKDLAGLLVAGDPAGFGAFKYDSWYTRLTASTGGLWAGNGLDSQNGFSLSYSRDHAQTLPPHFAWSIKGKRVVLLKHVVVGG
jgi:hypothetical protein